MRKGKIKGLNYKSVLVAIVAAACLVGGVLVYRNVNNPDPKPLSEQSESQSEGNGSADSPVKDPTPNPAAPSPNSPGNNPSVNDGAVTITSATLSGNEVRVRTLVEGLSSGTCTLTISMAGQPTITKTAKLGAVTSYYTCQGWNINRSEFPVGGQWQAKVKVVSGTKSVSSETKSISL